MVSQELAVFPFELAAAGHEMPLAVLILDAGFSIWPVYCAHPDVFKLCCVLLVYPILERRKYDGHLLYLAGKPVKLTMLPVTCKETINNSLVWLIWDVVVIRRRLLFTIHNKAGCKRSSIIFPP